MNRCEKLRKKRNFAAEFLRIKSFREFWWIKVSGTLGKPQVHQVYRNMWGTLVLWWEDTPIDAQEERHFGWLLSKDRDLESTKAYKRRFRSIVMMDINYLYTFNYAIHLYIYINTNYVTYNRLYVTYDWYVTDNMKYDIWFMIYYYYTILQIVLSI